MGFLSISYTIRAKSIIRLEIFNSMLPPAALRALNVLVYGFMLVVFTYLCYQSLSIISDTNQRWSSVNLSMNYVYSAIPVGIFADGTPAGPKHREHPERKAGEPG